MTENREPNQPAPGNGAVASACHVGRLVRAVPEQVRWAETLRTCWC